MSFSIFELVTEDRVTKPYQLLDRDGNPEDITGMVFEFAARETPSSATYEIDPITADIVDAENGKFSFTIDVPADPFNGVYEITMSDGINPETTLTPLGGVDIIVGLGIIR